MFFKSKSQNKLDIYSDDELLKLYALEHNQQYISTLFNRYSHLIFLISQKYLEDSDSAKDMTMDIYEKLIVKLKTQKVTNFKSWVYSVTKNECLMLLRKKNVVNKKVQIFDVNFVESDGFLNQEDEQIFTSNLINEKIEELDVEQKECIKRFYFDRHSYKEIAKLTMFSEKKVKSYLQNGKRNLKIALLKTVEES